MEIINLDKSSSSISPELLSLWKNKRIESEDEDELENNNQLIDDINALQFQLRSMKVDMDLFKSISTLDFFLESELEKSTLTPINCHVILSQLYIGLREVAVNEFALILEWFGEIEKVIVKQIDIKSLNSKINKISEVLKRHFRYLTTPIQKNSECCYYHKQYFTQKRNLEKHLQSIGHLKSDSYLYDQYVMFSRNSKSYSLSDDDEEFITNLEGIEDNMIPYKVAELNMLRNKLPLLGLLDFDMDDTTKGGLNNIIRLLGHYAHLSDEDQTSVLENFDSCKVSSIC